MPPVPFRLSLLFVAVVLASAVLTQDLPPLTGTGARPLAIVITVAGALALGAGILAMARKRRDGAGRATAWSVRADVPGHDLASFPLRPAVDRLPSPEPHEPEDREPDDRGPEDDPADDWSGQRAQPEVGVDWANPTAPPVESPAPASSLSETFASELPPPEPVAPGPFAPEPFAPASSLSEPFASEPPPPGPPPTGPVEPEAPARVPSPPDKPWWNEDPDDFRAELLADAGRSVERTPPPAPPAAPPSDRSDGR